MFKKNAKFEDHVQEERKVGGLLIGSAILW